MHRTTRSTRPVVTTDGTAVVSHAGTVLLAELADRIGWTAALSEATDGLRERQSGHDPGRVLVDVAVAIADGARTISDAQGWLSMSVCTVRPGSVPSTSDDLAGPGRRRRADAGWHPPGSGGRAGPGVAGPGG